MARCPPPFGGWRDFDALLTRAGEPPNVSLPYVVNLGAHYPWAEWDHDHAWDFVKHHPNATVVAFEMDSKRYEHLLQHHRGDSHHGLLSADRASADKITLLHRACSTRTIVRTLEENGVPRRFALLKVDIDSFDLPLVEAIVRAGFAPTIIFAEFQNSVPLPIEFAAREPEAGELLNASYQGVHWNGANRQFGCAGASLSSWAAFATAFGYTLVATDSTARRLGSNVVLLRNDAHARAGEWTLPVPPMARPSSTCNLAPDFESHCPVRHRHLGGRLVSRPVDKSVSLVAPGYPLQRHVAGAAADDDEVAARIAGELCRGARRPRS
jgi:hypothetical protein